MSYGALKLHEPTEMPPKKKGNKKAQDDWEADLGETIPPHATEPNDTAADANADADANGDDATGGGGLMAMLRKNKEKRKKKGLADDDLVQGEDAPGAVSAELNSKAPQEATLEDEFALPEKKGKAAKGKPAAKKGEPADDDDDDDDVNGGRILTKAEKEKLKKEREKQRKKEQVCLLSACQRLYLGIAL